MARPTKFKEDYIRMAEVACREGGLTDKKLAKLFDTTEQTITTWKKKHPGFLASIKKGKEDYDTEMVENSLLKRALGSKYTEVTKEPCQLDGTDMVVTKTVRKLIVADTTAQIFWLKNRQPARWRDVRNFEHSGPENGPIDLKHTSIDINGAIGAFGKKDE